MPSSFHLIISTRLELFDHFLQLFNLHSHLLIPLFELPYEFFKVRPVYIGGVPRLTHPQELFDLLHLRAEPVILLVQVVVLILERLQLGVSL